MVLTSAAWASSTDRFWHCPFSRHHFEASCNRATVGHSQASAKYLSVQASGGHHHETLQHHEAPAKLARDLGMRCLDITFKATAGRNCQLFRRKRSLDSAFNNESLHVPQDASHDHALSYYEQPLLWLPRMGRRPDRVAFPRRVGEIGS